MSLRFFSQDRRDLELILISIYLPKCKKLCLGVFYRPPASSVALFDSLLDVIYVVNPFQFSQFVIVGDFNVNMMVCSSYNSYIVSFCSHFNLSQVVVDCTYVRADGYQSLLDLVFVSDPDHVVECSTVPPLPNSEQYGIFFFGSAVLFRQNKLGPRGKYGDMPTWSWIEHVSCYSLWI